MSAVRDISFEKAPKLGSHRLFHYIQGANLNNSQVSMTIPVSTSIVADSGPFHSSTYFVRFYLPSESFQQRNSQFEQVSMGKLDLWWEISFRFLPSSSIILHSGNGL
ncbi:hypothetical protein IFM89_037572 [Coptis chinensis]|uniref:Uncharacterized protein n=1 Tax=Coptis chinensis TaxID=261450 RepID=A0A835HRU6_9MAGN|nr:hypothetical protein IFM89_037572 [Coptis chinensis]